MNERTTRNSMKASLPRDAGANAVEFKTSLSEKLRTPLNAIIGFSELLALQPLPATAAGDVRHILKAARNVLAIVDQELTGSHDPELLDEIAPVPTCDILYIEDDVANFVLVQRILELRPPLLLKHATSGQTGIETALLDRPKLILLDLNLPDMNGAEVLRILRSAPDTAEIPVVVLSADATASQIERLLAAGARNYLTKPFDIDPFLAVIDEFTTANSKRP